ncbi:TonB-dependent receptor [Pacificibacter sp. AS14]|uniref:TonB-dependent receptor plug domain-containing protein n=1 Tax=Pacificibacter sp. AS14 TaxID=3135785 RepID=UPI003179764A
MAYKSNSAARLLCSTALSICAATTAFAQNVVSLDPIEVQRADPLGDAADHAASVYVSEAELERAAMGDLKDLFAGLSSVSVGGGIPIAQKIFVNGVDMLNLAVTVDGVSQNNRVFHHASSNAFDPGLMKSVRVDPGVAAADAGPNAVAGAVVMETVDVADILEDGDNFGGNTRISFSDNGGTATIATTVAARKDGYEALGYFKRASGDNYTDGSGAEELGTETDLQSALVKLAHESDAGHRVEFSAQKASDSGLRNPKANFGYTGSDLIQYDTTRTTIALQYENTNGGGMWDPSASIGFSENTVDAPNYEDSQGTTRTLNAKVQNVFHFSDVSTLTVGADFINQTSNYKDGTTFEAEEEKTNFGLFVQARVEPTERLKLSGGLRADWQDFSGAYDDYEDSVSGLSSNASAVYEVAPGLTVNAGYSNVFGGIQLADNYDLWDRAAYSPTYDWDYSGLETARSENFILGADYAAGDWTLGAELFKTQITDARSDDGNIDFETRGFNLSSTYDWGSGFARASFTRSEGLIDGELVASYYLLDYGMPLGDIIALEVQQELPNANLLIGGSIDAALAYDTGVAYTVEAPAYTVVNVFAEYTPPTSLVNMTIRAEINNLFDVDYADRATYGSDYGDLYSSLTTLDEPGRTISVIATIEF